MSWSSRHKSGAAVLMACVGFVFATSPVPAAAAGVTITDARITDSGGLACDASRGLYWTANANQPGVLYQVGAQGNVRGTVNYNAQPQDVEALALTSGALYVGDIGDPAHSRATIAVYRIGNLDATTAAASQYQFAYPDGPHDAAAMAVSPRGNVYIVTREASAHVYRAGLPAAPQAAPIVLKQVAPAPSWVTDAVFLPGGDAMVLRTYTSVIQLNAWNFSVIGQAATPEQRQGESVTRSLSGTGVVIGSKGAESTLIDVAVPQTVATLPPAPSAPPNRPASPSPTPASPSPAPGSAAATPSPSVATNSASSAATDNQEQTGRHHNLTGSAHTLVAAAVAVLISLVAGGLALVYRRE